MSTSEELRVLTFLHHHGTASIPILSRTCLRGLPRLWVGRVVSNLDWLGYVIAYHDGASQQVLALTAKGREYLSGTVRGGEQLAALRSAASVPLRG